METKDKMSKMDRKSLLSSFMTMLISVDYQEAIASGTSFRSGAMLMKVAKPRPPVIDPLDALRPPPLPSSVTRDIKPNSRLKSAATRDQKIKKEPLFLSYIDDEAVESSADESDDTMSEEGKAFIDDGDIHPISRKNNGRPRARISGTSPIPTTLKKKPKKEEPVQVECSSDEMDGIESVPDDVVKEAQNQKVDDVKSEDDSMDGIESVYDVESVSAQLDDVPVDPPVTRRPRTAAKPVIAQDTANVDHLRQSSPDSDSDVEMLDGCKVVQDPLPIQQRGDIDMDNEKGSDADDESDDDDLDIMKYVRHPVQPVKTENVPQPPGPSEDYLSVASSFDEVNGEEPYYEDDDDCKSPTPAELINRLLAWHTNASRLDSTQSAPS